MIIAYSFPPAGEVGVYRTIKFAKYLREFGWQPVVLTVDGGKWAKYDPSLLELVPDDVEIVRVPSFEALNEGEGAANAGKTVARSLRERIRGRLCRWWSWWTVPDTKVFWAMNALRMATRLVRERGIRTVYVSGKPFSSFVAGRMLKRRTGVRLIIDYRDPWTQNITYTYRSRFHTWLEKRMEQRAIAAADVVIVNTRVNRELLIEEFGEGQPPEKFITIHNGYDANDFKDVPASKYDRFTITYAGAFYFSVGSDFGKAAGDDVMRTYSPLYFFDALTHLFSQRPEIREHFRVNFMGVLGHGYDPLIEEKGLSGVVRRLGYLGYDEHLEVLRRSHALLLVLSRGEKSRGWIPSKFFQYLGSGNPVLGLVPEGEVREIIAETGGGVCVEPDDVAGAARALGELYDRLYQKRETFTRNESEVENYERKHQAGMLAAALNGIEVVG